MMIVLGTSWSMELGGDWARHVQAQASRLTAQPTQHMEMPTVARYLAGQRYAINPLPIHLFWMPLPYA